ncbi:hypothetical protein I8920_09285 [Curtobacterium sp. YC1]|uniref:hypothetical protein n=1 Tax=Curtobacterium sp. YC1 TaxID=2795488 RepID=UPI0018E50C72|nr:hypothetical protein [Curtobacterium sp. YC1]QQD75065.1 hypothetical protein I8920_09285 [Curtobacterium sp. YC1]
MLAEYERLVGSVATVTALATWLPTPEARLVVRGRGAEPVRLETATYGSVVEMLVVMDQRSADVERAAAAIASLIEAVRHEHVADDVSGVAGELDRLDRAAPRGRSAVERSLRAFLQGARADVFARRTTTRVRTAQALLRLAEADAVLTVERVADALAPVLEEQAVDVELDGGSAVIVGTGDGAPAPDAVTQPDDGTRPDDGTQPDDGADIVAPVLPLPTTEQPDEQGKHDKPEKDKHGKRDKHDKHDKKDKGDKRDKKPKHDKKDKQDKHDKKDKQDKQDKKKAKQAKKKQ